MIMARLTATERRDYHERTKGVWLTIEEREFLLELLAADIGDKAEGIARKLAIDYSVLIPKPTEAERASQ
jgi:hypothetical protein